MKVRSNIEVARQRINKWRVARNTFAGDSSNANKARMHLEASQVVHMQTRFRVKLLPLLKDGEELELIEAQAKIHRDEFMAFADKVSIKKSGK